MYQVMASYYWVFILYILNKLQVIQNKLLKLLLNYDRWSLIDLLYRQLSLMVVTNIHNASVLSFVLQI